MAKETIEQLVNGGAASAAPPLGPALGPLGVNIGEVIKAINEKTAAFKGMQVPVKITADTETKAFEIEVGTPPATSLLKKEAGIEKASGDPKTNKVADLKIEQIIKVSQMKEGDLLGKTAKSRVKEIIGTCVSMGILVEGVDAKDAIGRVDAGEFDAKIESGKTELTAEELKELEEEKKKLKEQFEKQKGAWKVEAEKIIAPLKKASEMKKQCTAAGIPAEIYEPLIPKDAK